MTAQRLVLLLTNLQHIENVETKFSWVSSALLRGIWFDNVIACYISVLPLVVLSVVGLFNVAKSFVFNIFNVFYIVIYTLVFGIGIADVPYFNYFFKHLNASIFNWNEEGGTTVGMVFQEVSYYAYIVFFVVSIVLFGYLLFKLSRKLLERQQQNIRRKEYLLYIPVCMVLIAACFFGIRGRFGYNPIRTSQAYFCDNSFLNQLGINPSFYFMRNVIESSKSHNDVNYLVSEEDAIINARKALGMNPHSVLGRFPIARDIVADGDPKNMNIVVILMESMSADILKIKEDGKEITPFLNQLIEKSYYFENFYSAGTHTNHGILATLYGLPALFDKNIMKNVDIPLCQGMPDVLQDEGYRTMFFMTHEAQYDNMNAFLMDNGVEEIYSQEDYPSDKQRNSFGVADDFLLEYGLDKISEKSEDSKPFLATLLTVSNHPPYIVPDEYEDVSEDAQYQIVAFADDAIRQFMEDAQSQDWYSNTIFVLLGDHGKIIGSQAYEMPLSYNHIPFIIYSPAFEDAPQRFEQLGGQIDVFPTLMGLLNRSYQNNTFGIDLFKEKRPYMYFTSDNALGCINEEYFYIYNPNTKMDGLYSYRNDNTSNFEDENATLADSMKTYAASMMITADYLVKNKLTRTNMQRNKKD